MTCFSKPVWCHQGEPVHHPAGCAPSHAININHKAQNKGIITIFWVLFFKADRCLFILLKTIIEKEGRHVIILLWAWRESSCASGKMIHLITGFYILYYSSEVWILQMWVFWGGRQSYVILRLCFCLSINAFICFPPLLSKNQIF